MRLPGYFHATRHPWPGLLFVVPLLAIYEARLLFLAHGQPDGLRNGADTWLRWALAHLGLAGLLWAPVLLLGLLLLWTLYRRSDRPQTDLVTVWGGMTAESILFAVGLWGLSRSVGPLLARIGLSVTGVPSASAAASDATLEHLISFLGAGVYEEALFRLVLFSGLIWLFRLLEFPGMWALTLAAALSALAFAAAHNVGPHGEHFAGTVFLFRSVAGLYLAMVFQLRGFGVAVGAHTGYDVLVGVLA